MIECARCGFRNDAAAKFCAACGAPMIAAQPAPALAHPGWGQPSPQPASPPGWGAPPMQQPVAPQFGAPSPAPVAQPWQAQAAPQPQQGYGPAPTPQGYGGAPQAQQHGFGAAPAPQPQGYGPAPIPQGYGGTPQAQQHAFGPSNGPGAQGYASPYGAAPWAAPAPVPQGPAWGAPAPAVSPYAPPQDLPLAPTVPEPSAAPVVPTTASAVMEPLEADQLPANAPKALAAFLVTFESNPLGEFWPIHQGTTLIGRKDSGSEPKLEVDHPTTSSRHAHVYAAARPSRLKVEDLGSTNGTYVNERRLESGERRTLNHGDTLRFGGFSVTVHLV